MSIQFSGIGSGLPVQDWIDSMIQAESTRLRKYYEDKNEAQNAKNALSSVESKFSSLKFSLEKLTDANIAKTLDLFEQRTVGSSNEEIATASASANAAIQKVDLEVVSLATATTAQSNNEVGEVINGSEKFADLANGEAEEGVFSLYVDGVKQEFTIEEDDTLNDIISDLNSISGLEASITDGKFQIKTDDDEITNLTFGSSSDTSNFLNVVNLATADSQVISEAPYDKLYESTDSVSTVNTEGKIIDGSANLSGSFSGAYTFEIGGSEFTVDSNTTLQGLISRINNDDDANVLISYDSRENKFNLTSKEAGETAINLEDTSGDFLQQVGLITAGGDSLSSQTLGENAKVRINDSAETIEVNSNTITSDISGIAGVTISLKDVTEAGESITLDIKQDTEELTGAVDDFITKFNKVINEVDKETSKNEDLYGEYSLVSIRNSLRTMVMDMVPGLGEYNSFGMAGISTGDIGKSVEEETNTLKFDKDKFLEALEDNPNEVKALLIGDSDQGVTGILQRLEEKVESVVDPVNGYFSSMEDSFNTTIANLDDTIERETERLDTRREQLTRKFNQMDQYISQMQQQQSALSML